MEKQPILTRVVEKITGVERCDLTGEKMETSNDYQGYTFTPEKVCPPCEMQEGCPLVTAKQ